MVKRILISNDDCYLSPGLYLLADAVEGLGEVLITSTEFPRSATGREITFSRPLRFTEKSYGGRTVYVTDGTPIDALHLAIDVLGFKPDIVLSGVNVGDNLSLQHIFYSGTLAVAIEASLMGIPSIAFSAGIDSFRGFENPQLKNVVRRVAKHLTAKVLNEGMPSGIDLLSVNIPLNSKGCVKVVKATRIRWRAAYRKGVDPRGRAYYWLYGVRSGVEVGTDVAEYEDGCVTITPLNIDLNVDSGRLKIVESLVAELNIGGEGSST